MSLALALLLQTPAADTAVTGVISPVQLFQGETLRTLLRLVVLVFVGTPAIYGLSRWTRGWVARKYTPQQGLIAGKVVFYPGLVLLLVTVLQQLGFSLTPLLGAAGILGIAIGFASQTSVSNIISGFFLIAERPFQIDDMVQVGDTVGRVLSIDTLSVKIRTFDNRFIRIPNETIVKSQVTTITRFPIRRLDLNVGVAYKENVAKVREVLLDVARRNPKALMEPEPALYFDGYGDSALELRLTVWAIKENFLALKTSLLEQIKNRFDEEGIEIPFPHRTLYTGEVTDPFPIRLADAQPADPQPADPQPADPQPAEREVEAGGPEGEHGDPPPTPPQTPRTP